VSEEGLLIESVLADSIAAELDIEPGDRLLMVNGAPLRDIIDYNFHAADDELLFLVKKADGDLWELEFDRFDGEPVGLYFSTPVPASCGNNCVFCFVHQLPRGLRKPLYVKDEDYRLSFLYGNYVTLANITAAEVARIIEQRLSPLYISVHATDPALREKLLGRNKLVPISETIAAFARAGIQMHTQIVLCPGLNDGAALDKTVNDLAAFYPQVASLAVVPLGLTRHRRGLPQLQPVTSDYAGAFIAEWLPKQLALQEKLGGEFLFLADEFFIKAGVEFPPLATYGELPQLENGVGMIPLFEEEAAELLQDVDRLPLAEVTVVTGVSPLRYITAFSEQLARATTVRITVVPVENRFFGKEVTVTGLVTGSDIVSALQGRGRMELLLVPEVMLKEGEGLFLDEMDCAGLAAALGCRVESFPATPEGFYQKLIELAEERAEL
jgi:putative radical SAM enzyme (TIGR03279 family)